MTEFSAASSSKIIPRGRLILAATLVAAAMAASAAAQAAGQTDAVGRHFELRLSDLPLPYAAVPQDAVFSSQTSEEVARPAQVLPTVPPGFHVGIFAENLERPREIAVGPGGVVFVSQMHEGDVVALRDTDGDGLADEKTIFADGFREPSGLAVEGDALYIADRRAVWRIDFDETTLKAEPRIMITRPGALGEGGGHVTREIAFAPDGRHFFVSIGSETNVGEEQSPRATIQQFRADGQMQMSFATGLRNPVGLAFYPGTDDLYAVVNERDGLGKGLVPDYLTRIEPGGFYGFPYAYLGPHPDPQFGDLRPDLVRQTLVPDMLFPAQSVPLGLLFYHGNGFPPDYQGDALVALHGGWKGAPIHGIARVHFHDGRPEPGYEIFMSGFEEAEKAEAGSPGLTRIWGRPVWLAEEADGSLLVSDDVANVIWHVSWAGPTAANEPKTLGTAPAGTLAIH